MLDSEVAPRASSFADELETAGSNPIGISLLGKLSDVQPGAGPSGVNL